MSFALDPRLAGDTHHLASLPLCELLLMDNALLPWLILVPRVSVTELYQLPAEQRRRLDDETTAVAAFVAGAFAIDKLNVAAIGNVVAQLHVHVVGRRRDDYAWPGVVWGRSERTPYEPDTVAELRSRTATVLAGERATTREAR